MTRDLKGGLRHTASAPREELRPKLEADVRCRVTVPASTSNLGPGFDCLGLALDLTLQVEASVSGDGSSSVELDGPEVRGVPRDESNLILRVTRETMQRLGATPPALHLRLHNEIPIARGLGSSGAAITAGVTLAHLLSGPVEPDRATLLADSARVEGHPDNVAPQVLGGFVAAAQRGERVHTARLPVPERLEILLVIPEYEVPTQEARRILPDPVALEDAVFNLSHVALLCGALVSDDDELLRVAMHDRLHERHRIALVPGLEKALASLRAEPDCVAATLSGSGPTLLALYRSVPETAGQEALASLERHGIAARLRRARPRREGVEWQRQSSA